MTNIMWVQWENPTDTSRLVVDGEVSGDPATPEQYDAMYTMVKTYLFREICAREGDENLSPCFRVSRSLHGTDYCVEGNLEETDSSGRKMDYIFVTDASTSEDIAKCLHESAAALGVTPHAADIEKIIQLQISKNKKVWIILVALFLFLFLFFITR